MTPLGKLLIIGGHEDKGAPAGQNLDVHKKIIPQTHFEILGSLISKIPRVHHNIEIIAAASSIRGEVEELYLKSFKQQGFTHVGHIKVDSKEDAGNPASLKRIKAAHAVFFTGGDQEKLVSLLAGTKLLTAIRHKYISDKHFIIAGTSAGAMAMPEIIITGGIIAAALYREDIKISQGLDLIRGVIIDTHFIKRGRFARLAHAVALNPSCLGIGLEEDSSLLISGGNTAECIGSGMVIMMDGSKISSTNVKEAAGTTPIVMDNLIVSILAEGSQYIINEKYFSDAGLKISRI